MLLPLHDDNPLKNIRFQYVTIAVIAACVAVFLYQLSLGGAAGDTFIFGFGAIPAVVFGSRALPEGMVAAPAALSLVTSMFLHGGFMHLAGNMLFLWVLGFWIGYQFLSASMAAGGAGGGVAWWAHIGGFVAGVILIVPMRKKGVQLFDSGRMKFELRMGVEKAPRGRSRIPRSGGSGPKGPWG